MNQLKLSQQQSILTLHKAGWSNRAIARELDLNRETVGKYLRSESALISEASVGSDESKPAISTAGSLPTPKAQGRPSLCETWRTDIEAAVEAGLSAQRIYQDLVTEHQFAGSYQSVKRFVRRIAAALPLPFRRMECAPGQEVQVDFGQGAWVLVEGKRKGPHLLGMVLSHSRKGYSEVVWRQTTENFVRGLENAFRHFGGVAQTTVIDNLRAAPKPIGLIRNSIRKSLPLPSIMGQSFCPPNRACRGTKARSKLGLNTRRTMRSKDEPSRAFPSRTHFYWSGKRTPLTRAFTALFGSKWRVFF